MKSKLLFALLIIFISACAKPPASAASNAATATAASTRKVTSTRDPVLGLPPLETPTPGSSASCGEGTAWHCTK